MIYTDELQFEKDLIEVLKTKGWENETLNHPTEQDLIDNWREILFQNNRSIDRLNNKPLTDTEMQQILEQITRLRTPLKLNGFINGVSINIKRDNSEDILHFGKEISLKIYDRNEIAAGQSRYQIAEQPLFKTNPMLNNRRGDIMLLINGMPVIHIELKKSNIDVTQAAYQIEKYAKEGVFTGLFSLVQIFVAMNPEETLYFANPGPDGKFNNKFYFHWANFNNEPINNWKEIADKLLSIPMAHQLIGFYTVADNLDGTLKVMRSYQYYAAHKISDKVTKNDWDSLDSHGGYIWHTTGSGKTLTSFKSAELIANSKDADKVVFLLDRIELGDQSLRNYRGFVEEDSNVADTKNTYDLIKKLKSNNISDTLIVTSIQKMSRIKNISLNVDDIAIINKKRLVFIIDECHRDTFGEMLISIKETFPKALFFGFTGTPILKENTVKGLTQSDVFGDELHRYSIADGIRDGNVLGFDPCMVKTFSDISLREAVALEKAKAKDIQEVLSNEQKKDIYYNYMNQIPMCGYFDENNIYRNGIEDYIPNSQYDNAMHREQVIKNIISNWDRLSYNKTFSAILATSSIKEAIEYYKMFKLYDHDLNITGLFDPTLDNTGGAILKEEGLIEIIEDYNKMFHQLFTIPTYDKMKKDISLRLAHKHQYAMIDGDRNEQLDLLIVVDQMLTGYDSKWLNTLYLDKVLKYQNVIQAFSRTNRIFGKGKDFGVIKYYRKTNTMKRNIETALKSYSGNKPFGIFVDKIEENLKNMNIKYDEIKSLFNSCNIYNFERLPEDKTDRAKFVRLFQDFYKYLNAARVQGFKWDKNLYYINQEGDETVNIAETLHENPISQESDVGTYNECVKTECDVTTFEALVQRYNEVQNVKKNQIDIDVPYKIDPTIIEIDTGKIDADYMNSKFNKYLKVLSQKNIPAEELQKSLDELHKSFATLSQEEQKYANILIHDIDSGNIELDPNKTFMDYIYEYARREKVNQIKQISNILGYDEELLKNIMQQVITEKNIDDFGRFEKLSKTIDMEKARKYFDKIEEKELQPYEVYQKSQNLLRQFILNNGFDISINKKE